MDYLKFILNLILMLIFALSFSGRITDTAVSLLGRSQMDLMCGLYFWGDNRQHMPICVKMISSLLGKFWVMQRHMSSGNLSGASVSVTLAVGVSMVSTLQVGDWTRLSTPARHYFCTCITTSDEH